MKWPAFSYARAESLTDLWRLRAAAGPDSKVIAGGQSLLATLAFRLSQPSVLIDITGIAALSGITDHGNHLRIGALTRHVELERLNLIREKAPLLTQAAPLIAHAAIRNRGTLGGSLAFADPAAELPACMVALGADVIAVGPNGERRIAADAFFTGLFETALAEDEIILAVDIPSATAGAQSRIQEITRRSGDYAMAGLAAWLAFESGVVRDARLVFFGVGAGPVVAKTVSQSLVGHALTPEAVARARALAGADLDPPADQHGPPAMKRHLAGVLTDRVLTDLLPSDVSSSRSIAA